MSVRALPGDRVLAKEKNGESRRDANGTKHEAQREPRHEARQEQRRESGSPLPDSAAEQPPLIRRQEVVAISLVGLLAIATVAVLYFARAFLNISLNTQRKAAVQKMGFRF
jgi:hypothetical protein